MEPGPPTIGCTVFRVTNTLLYKEHRTPGTACEFTHI